MAENSIVPNPNQSCDVFGIGVSVMDTILVVDELPTQESVAEAKARSVGIGGGVTVALSTIGLLGGSAELVDKLGVDVTSQAIVDRISQCGVNTANVVRDSDCSPSLACVLVLSKNGSRSIIFSPGNAESLNADDKCLSAIGNAKILHINGRHLQLSKKAASLAHDCGTKVSYDGGAHRYRKEVVPLLHLVDFLIVSEQFAMAHAESKAVPYTDASSLASLLQDDFGCELVVITLGEKGSWISPIGCSSWLQPVFNMTDIIDTTGCGDTYHGGFLWAITRGASYKECGEIASYVSAQNTQGLGALAFDCDSTLKQLHKDYSHLF
jgi:sugar/nucleoside kinase (ribokinase family)